MAYQGFTLAGLHLRDLALVQDDAPHDLHVEMALPQRAHGRLPHRGERLREQLIQGGPIPDPCPEPLRAGTQFGVSHPLHLRLQRVHNLNQLGELLQPLALSHAQHFPESLEHETSLLFSHA